MSVQLRSLLFALTLGATAIAPAAALSPRDDCAALPPVEQAVLGRLQQVGGWISHQLELARVAARDGRLDRDLMTARADSLARELDTVDREIARLEPGEQQPLRAKVAGLRGLLHNLELAVAAGSAPFRPEVAPATVRPTHVRSGPAGPPANDACAGATLTGVGVLTGSTLEATNDGEASCGASLFSPDVWFRFRPALSGTYVVETAGSDFDTVLSAHTGCPGTTANEIACNDDYFGLQSAILLDASAGIDYLIRVAGMGGATGHYRLSIGKGGSIGGDVLSDVSGDPIPDAWVEVLTLVGDYVGSTQTDQSGKYIVPGLPTGSNLVACFAPWGSGYIDELYDDHQCPGGPPRGCDLNVGDPVSVTSGGTTPGVDFSLALGGTVTGTVRDAATGLGVEWAHLQLYDQAGNSTSYSGYTEPDGTYAVTGVPGGSYFVLVFESDYTEQLYDGIPCPGGPPSGCTVTSGTAVAVSNGTTTPGIDFDLLELGSISGTVMAADAGLPLPGANIEVFRENGSWAGYAYSDDHYRVGGLADGSYLVVAGDYLYRSELYDGVPCDRWGDCPLDQGTPVVVAGHGAVTGIDLTLDRLGGTSGTVTEAGSGQPIDDAYIVVYDENGSSVEWTSTDPTGTYSGDGVWPGNVFSIAQAQQHLPQLFDDLPCPYPCDPTTGTPIPVSFNTVTPNIDFNLTRSGSIAGLLTVAGTGAPLAGINIEAYNHLGSYAGSGSTLADGSYVVDSLDSGTYFVVTHDNSGTIVDQLYQGIPCPGGPGNGCNPVSGTPVTVTPPSTTTGIDFSVQLASVIQGSVTDVVTGGPLPYGWVVAFDQSGAQKGWAYSDFQGAYSVGGLAAGAYYVLATGFSDSVPHLDQLFLGVDCPGGPPYGCPWSAGTPVQVAAGSTVAGINFPLDRFAAVSGVVTDAAVGRPLPSSEVVLYDSAGQALSYASTDANGIYVGWAPASGACFVATRICGQDYIDQLYDGIPCPGCNCDVTAGTPVPLALNQVTGGVDFALGHSAGIGGRVLDGRTGVPLPDTLVRVYDTSGSQVAYSYADGSGTYRVGSLLAGTYYVVAGYSWGGYVPELYDGFPCLGGPPDGCDPTKGTPVPVTAGHDTRFIDFALPERTNSIVGRVTRSADGSPLANVAIDVWDTTSGQHEAATYTDATGGYLLEIYSGTYYVSTDNNQGYRNEIWDDIPCALGSAYDGTCDPTVGDPVVVDYGVPTGGIDFALLPQRVFADGFEAGTTAAWSLAVP